MSIRILTRWLSRNTAFSAKKVKDDGDITQAGIASHISADIYGLRCLRAAYRTIKTMQQGL